MTPGEEKRYALVTGGGSGDTPYDVFFDHAVTFSGLNYTLLPMPAYIDWGSGTYDLPEFQNAFPGQGLGCLQGDPSFVDADNSDFRLQSDSPARNTGAADDAYQEFYSLYGIDIAKDFAGRARPQGPQWDMGALEYVE